MREYLTKTNAIGDNNQNTTTQTAGEQNSINKALNLVAIEAGVDFSAINPAGEDVSNNVLIGALNKLIASGQWWQDNGTTANQILLARNGLTDIYISDNLFEGFKVAFINANTNTGSVTIKVGNNVAIDFKNPQGIDFTGFELQENTVVQAVFDGNVFRLIESASYAEYLAKSLKIGTMFVNFNNDLKDVDSFILNGIQMLRVTETPRTLSSTDYPVLAKFFGVTTPATTFDVYALQDGVLRFLPSGDARDLGSYQLDALQDHDSHQGNNVIHTVAGGSSTIYTGALKNGDITGARVADETRMKNTGVQLYIYAKIVG